jgi:hypothetical protein
LIGGVLGHRPAQILADRKIEADFFLGVDPHESAAKNPKIEIQNSKFKISL